jgi:hypothetical protein
MFWSTCSPYRAFFHGPWHSRGKEDMEIKGSAKLLVLLLVSSIQPSLDGGPSGDVMAYKTICCAAASLAGRCGFTCCD